MKPFTRPGWCDGDCEVTFGHLSRLVDRTLSDDITPAMLRAGVVEETGELNYDTVEVAVEGSARKTYLTKEVGDGLWYVGAIRKYYDVTLPGVHDKQLMTGYQGVAFERGISVPIRMPDGLPLAPDDTTRSTLAVTALRVVDKLNPKTDGLWHGTDREAHSLSDVLEDYLSALACFAVGEDIGLGDAVRATERKLQHRVRKPHVVAEDIQSSMRERLVRVLPWVQAIYREQAEAVQEDYWGGRLPQEWVY